MKVVNFFLGADLRCQHNGLKKLAGINKINLDNLGAGEAVVFINSAKNKLKAYSYNGAITFIRFDDKNKPIDMGALNEIPKAFSPDGTLDYKKALQVRLQKKILSTRYINMEVI